MTQPGLAPQHPITRALSAIHARPRWACAALVLYAAAVSFPHTQVQWAVNELAIRIGFPNLYRLFAGLALLPAVVLTVLRTRSSRDDLRLWILTLALSAGVWAGLTGNNVELVHYPQYFPEGVVLLALTLSPVDAISWVVLFGGLDEAWQYWFLPRSRVSLFDFNDIYMDLLGGAAGVVFAMAFLRTPRTQGRMRPGVVIILSLALIGMVLWASGAVVFVADKAHPHYWFALADFRPPSFWAHVIENGPKHYHTLTPLEGMVLIFATIGLYGTLTDRG